VKRIIGLPGDKIEMKGTDVLVNGKTIVDGTPDNTSDHLTVHERAESGDIYTVFWKPNSAGSNLSVTVPDGQIFILGDNRDDAVDSRKFGTVPVADVNGVAKQVWYSTGDAGLRIGKWVGVN